MQHFIRGTHSINTHTDCSANGLDFHLYIQLANVVYFTDCLTSVSGEGKLKLFDYFAVIGIEHFHGSLEADLMFRVQIFGNAYNCLYIVNIISRYYTGILCTIEFCQK